MQIICEHKLLQVFFKDGTIVVHMLLAAFYPLLNGGGKLALGVGSDDPLPACLEGYLRQQEASQLEPHSTEGKMSAWALSSKEVRWRIVQMPFATVDVWTESAM
jgi:hypothetical protein